MRQEGPATEHIRHGEVRIAASPDACFSTILGSCVATILWDPERGVGGMNHLLLPPRALATPREQGPEVNLLELLINGVVAAGAERQRLRAKIFGGARMLDGRGSTGDANVAFVEGFLREEGIACVAASTGGRQARRLRAWPAFGRVQQLRLRERDAARLALETGTKADGARKLSGVELL